MRGGGTRKGVFFLACDKHTHDRRLMEGWGRVPPNER